MTPNQFFNEGGWIAILIFPLGPPLIMFIMMMLVEGSSALYDWIRSKCL
jgi:hypothetical protein